MIPGGLNIPSVALRVHNIKQRQLYGTIQDQFYAVNVRAHSSPENGERFVASFVRDIQDWYDSSPLKTAFVPIGPATIAKQVSRPYDRISTEVLTTESRRSLLPPNDPRHPPTISLDAGSTIFFREGLTQLV